MFHKFLIGLTIVGKHAWQQEEERKGDISTAIMFQENLFIAELFKDIQDATSLIIAGQCDHSERISRQAHNRRRRTREGPEPACVQTPFHYGVAHAGVEG